MTTIIKPFEEAVKFLWQWGIENNNKTDDITQMTPQAAYSVYKHKYWDAIHADTLPWDLAIVAFDAAVKCGSERTNQWIEKALTDKNPVRAFNEKRRIYILVGAAKNPIWASCKDKELERINDLRKLVDVLHVSVAEGTATVEVPSKY